MPGKLTYFEVSGRSEGIRMMLAHANFQYEDCRLPMAEFGQKKAAGYFPLGSMPIWEEDGFKMCQSSAIMRMLGIRLGYYSDDPMTAWCIDSIVDFCEDYTGKHVVPYSPLLGGQPFGEDALPAWYDGFWGKVIPVINKRLEGHGRKFIAGTDRPTIADFKAFQTVIVNLDSNSACILPAHARQKLKEMFAAAPSYNRWVQSMEQEMASYISSGRVPTPF